MKDVAYFMDVDDIKTIERINDAEKAGLTVRFPGPREVFLDIDTVEQTQTMLDNLTILNSVMDCSAQIEDMTVSASGGHHRHVVVTVDFDLTKAERNFLQIFLGSDPLREILGFRAVKMGGTHPNFFIEGPWADKHIEEAVDCG